MSEKVTKIIKLITIIGVLVSIFIIFVNSSIDLYVKRNVILSKLGIHLHDDHNEKRYLINPLKQSDRQIPTKKIKD